MTVKDRVLCAIGFHGKFEDTGSRIGRVSRPGELTQTETVIGRILRCSICGRLRRECV